MHRTYNVPHIGPFWVIEVWVTFGVPLYSLFYKLLLGPVHLRMEIEIN